jgi:flagellar M-ring protein FliF
VNPEQIVAHFKKLAASLTAKQILGLATAFILVVGIVVGSAYFISTPDYVLLVSDMDAETAASVTGKLRDAKVEYQLADGGRAVRVPATRVDELRMQIASTGLPSAGHIGYEIFDRPAFGTTEFLEQVNYKRALEGELARTISTLTEVQSARVSIAMAKDSLFVDQTQPAKASVVLKLKNPNRPLAQATVRGIASLLSGSVEQLRPESVTIVDTFGHFLSAPVDENDTSANAGVQLDRQQQIERDLSNKVVSLLEPIVGSGRVRANVSASLRADAIEETVEKMDPASVIIGRATLTETNSLGNPMGVAGARANQPAGNSTSTNPTNSATANPAATAANATPPNGNAAGATPAPATTPVVTTPPLNGGVSTTQSGSNRQQDTTNYVVGKSTRHVISPQGQLARLSVAVIIDNQRVAAPAPAAGGAAPAPPASKPWDTATLTQIRTLVSSGVGLDETRGDKLTVENISFDAPSIQTDTVADAPTPSVVMQQVKLYAPSALRTLAIIVVAWFALFGVLRPIMRQTASAPGSAPALSAPAATAAVAGMKGPSVQEMEGQIEAELDAATGQRRKLPVLTKRVAKLASQEPEQLARIVRGWMAEGDR